MGGVPSSQFAPLRLALVPSVSQSIQPKYFRAEVRKFLSWCHMDRDRSERSRSIPFAKRVSHSLKMKDVGSMLLVLKLDDDFDGDINDIVRAASFIVF